MSLFGKFINLISPAESAASDFRAFHADNSAASEATEVSFESELFIFREQLALKIEPSVEKELKKDFNVSDFKSVITGYRIEGRMMNTRHATLEIPQPKANFDTFGWCLCALTFT